MVNRKNSLGVFLIIILSSCTTLYSDKSHYKDVDRFLENGQSLDALNEFLDSRNKYYREKDKVLYYLEEGMLYRYAGMYKESNESLTKAEYGIEEFLTKSISKGILSGVLNDNSLDYSGEDYEDIYINIFKALNYFQLNLVEEAMVEIRRVNFKLSNLETKYIKELSRINSDENVEIPNADYLFYNDALARYLGVIGYRQEGSYDDSRIEQDYFNSSFLTQSQIYNFSKPEPPLLESPKAIVNLFSYSGFAPEKVPDTIIVHSTSSDLIIGSNDDYIGFSKIGGYTDLSSNLSLKLEFPRLEKIGDPVTGVEVLINGISYGYMDLVENIDSVAFETFKLKQPLIVGKTVVRAVSKAMVSELSEDLVTDQFGEGFGLLASIAGDVFMQVSENSDLRISRYLPSKVRVLEVELDPGFYDITYRYTGYNGNTLFVEDFINQEVVSDGINLFESTLMRKQ